MPKTEIINQDPFCDVRIKQLEHEGNRLDKFVVEMEAPENGGYRVLPGTNTVHSENYQLIPNLRIHQMVLDVLSRTGREFAPVPEFGGGYSKSICWNGKKYCERWYLQDAEQVLPNGNNITLGLEAFNSYDGSLAAGIRFFVMHMLCSNQFYSSNLLKEFIFYHYRSANGNLEADIDETVGHINSQAVNFTKIVPFFSTLQEKQIDKFDDFLKIRQGINTFWTKSRENDVLDEMSGNGITAQLGMAQNTDTNLSYWKLLNAYTAVSTHRIGGFPGARLSEQVTDHFQQLVAA